MLDLMQRLDRLYGEMTTARQSYYAHWKELSEFIQPRNGVFDEARLSDPGKKKHGSIINNTATRALATARSGLLAGASSPARPWFKFQASNPAVRESQAVQEWIHSAEKLILDILHASNFYVSAGKVFEQALIFATGGMLQVDDFEDVTRFHPQPIGTFCIRQNTRGDVDTFARELEYTVEELVEKFGLENCTDSVKNSYETKSYARRVKVRHIILPNTAPQFKKGFSRKLPFRGVYYEPASNPTGKFLEDKGFHEFPFMNLRWDVEGEEDYGVLSPGMAALGDVKQLQTMAKRKAQAIDKMVSPPLVGPANVRGNRISVLPSAANLFDGFDSKSGLRPIYQVNAPLRELKEDEENTERRIEYAFYTHLFRAISSMEGIQPRNQLDLSQRNQERLLELGPVLQNVNQHFLPSVIDRVFNQAMRADILPEAPPELEGQALDIEFISPLAMAQRAVAAEGIERVAGFVGSLASTGMEGALAKFDADKAVEEFANIIGVDPRLIVPDEVVQQQREAQAQQQQQAQQMEMADKMANTAQTMSATPTNGDTALKAVSDAAADYA
jgi:hypothetical protein